MICYSTFNGCLVQFLLRHAVHFLTEKKNRLCQFVSLFEAGFFYDVNETDLHNPFFFVEPLVRSLLKRGSVNEDILWRVKGILVGTWKQQMTFI
jgi:hypothetical protein